MMVKVKVPVKEGQSEGNQGPEEPVLKMDPVGPKTIYVPVHQAHI